MEEYRERITNLLLWAVRKLNRSKDRALSEYLFYHAEWYNTRPGTSNYAGLPEPPKWMDQ